ncbi:tetratricopeptide repeat protein [Fulvivirga sedimenti]|uniref:Tetratricopeptide repeat protein n=1 Tax=Fulvivirga sedimenti TaxID=2879465 RepID=A0A9X1HU54_9BACT|nr:tetratricopeptide repeat protein [Fulvivirga sedimenti]MCA6077970.1 tetratricopeptide repeat protein [Fulvivirga sedimenti]
MKYLTILLWLFGVNASVGQDWSVINSQARDEMKAGRYESAIALYQDAVALDDQNPETLFGLAEAFRLSFQYENAEINYRKVRNVWADQMPLSIYYYALMLKLGGNFERASGEFTAFITQVGNSGRYPEFLDQAYVEKAGADLALITQDEGRFQVHHLSSPVNSPFNDFSPAFLGEDILILTSGRGKGWTGKKDLKYGEGFMNQYAFRKRSNQWLPFDHSILDMVNSKYHDGNGSFSADFRRYFFTSCGDISVNCRIYVTEQNEQGRWDKPRPLNTAVNYPGYDAKQPSLSVGGDTLLFVSDRPGGKGMNDIWMSVSTGNGRWTNAVNLSHINTGLNELSPRWVTSELIVFSSEGHQNFGGFDFYIADAEGSNMNVVNIGKPFNSSRDDAYSTIHAGHFYWSSNRKGTEGNFDIYFSELPEPESFFTQVFESGPSARRDEVSMEELEKLEMVRKNRLEDPFTYETLPSRQKQLVDEVLRSRRAGRELPSELEYLSTEEREFIIHVANQQQKTKKD